VTQAFLSDSALFELGKLGRSVFTTPVTVYRRKVSTGATDYGDDYVSYDVVGRPWPTAEWDSAIVNVLFDKGLGRVQQVDTAQVVTVAVYNLWAPINTDIITGDQIATADASVYIVSNTNTDISLAMMLQATLLKLE
jgi:hypothetical protein